MSIAARYHELTKYDEHNVRGGPGLDWSKQPAPFKEIVSSQRVALRSHPPVTVAEGRPTPAEATPDGPLDLATLSRLLFFANGVTGVIRYGEGGGQFLRAAPSAGALYPTEIYLAARDVPGLAPGLYHYLAATHELVRLWDDPGFDTLGQACAAPESFAALEAALVVTGIYWRSAWRYKERGYRRVLLDTGHVLANIAASAPREGLRAQEHFAFVDAAVNGLFFFDDAEEAALACVGLATPDAPAAPDGRWASPLADADDVEAAALLDADELSASATVALHRGSCCAGPGAPVPALKRAPASDRAIPLAVPEPLDASIPSAILHRRSARQYGEGKVPFAALGRALGFTFAGSRGAELDAHVVALRVDGLEPGVYAVEGAGTGLRPLSSGSEHDRLVRLSLGQDIARGCAVALVLGVAAERALARWGDRAYRYAHLDAGALGQRFQLAAEALGYAACGVGGFFDDEAAALVGGSSDDWVCYLITFGVKG